MDIKSCNTSEVGIANLILGGGRETKESVIDLSVGIDIRKHIGDKVSAGETFAFIHGNDMEKIKEAKKRLLDAYVLSDEKVEKMSIIKEIIQ